MTQIEIAARNEELKALAKNGKTATEIANYLGIKRVRVLQLLRSYRIKPKREIHNLKSEKALEIINELKKGTKQSDIARKHQVSRQYVSEVKSKLQGK